MMEKMKLFINDKATVKFFGLINSSAKVAIDKVTLIVVIEKVRTKERKVGIKKETKTSPSKDKRKRC